MTETDNRRRQYVPVSSYIAFTRTGTALLERWEHGQGLLLWLLFLAACKREPIQGEFSYISDEDAHRKLGFAPSGFTLDEFFDVTGRLKQTRRRPYGRIKHVLCTHWEDWNKIVEGQLGRERKSSKQGTNTREMSNNYKENTKELSVYEYEGERDKGELANSRLIFDYWREQRGKPKARFSEKRRRKVRDRLVKDKFSVDDLKRAIDGVAADPWVDRHLYDDLELICRDAEHVERFISLAADKPPDPELERVKALAARMANGE